MNKEDKGKIIVASFIIGFWVVALGLFFLGKELTWPIILLVFVIIQQGYFVPKTVRLYYRLNKSKASTIGSYIPIYNEYMMYTPFYAWATMIIGIVQVLVAMSVVFPLIGIGIFEVIISSVFGYQAGMSYVFYAIVLFISLYIISSVLRGLGLMGIKSSVDQVHTEAFGKASYYPMEAGLYLCMFFPVGRLFAFGFISDRLMKMVEINDMGKLRKNSLTEEI